MTFSVPLLVALAPSIQDPALRAVVYKRLLGRTGTSAIFGAGLMHLGPVDRMCAHLTDDPHQQHEHLMAAIQVADLQHTRLWQVVCRREFAALSNDARFRDEAADLATTPALRELLAVEPSAT